MNPKKVKRSQSSRNLIAKKSEWKSVRILNPLKIKGQQQRKYYNKEKMNWRRCPRVGKEKETAKEFSASWRARKFSHGGGNKNKKMAHKIITAAIRIKNCVSDLHFWPYFLLYFSLAKNGGRNGAAEFILQRYFFYFGRLLFPLHFYSNSRLLIFHSLSRAINFPLPFIFHWGALILARE